MFPIAEYIILATLFAGLRATMAMGFSLIFGVSKIFYMAYGALYMIGAYMTYVAISILDSSPLFAVLLALAVPTLIGVLSFRFLVFPKRKEELTVVITTFALASILEQTIRLTLTPYSRTVSPFFPGSTSIFGTIVGNQRLASLGISFVALASLWVFIKRTRTGGAIRAVSENEELARITGIDILRITLLVVAMGSFFAGLSGFLLSPLYPIEPHMGWIALTEALTIVVLGGAGSIPGTVVGAIVVSFVEVLVGLTVSSSAAAIGTAVVLILTLLFRPKGLFGAKL